MRLRAAALESWAHTPDRAARTAAARRAMLDRFEQRADPERVLTVHERARRAEQLRRAHYLKMAAKSVESRRRKAQLRPGDTRP
ncbi:hypothetical protein GO011_06980 [Mycobacterium sp. 20091114027_K0903767]|nr:hypothetical protein [Mycobacterium sp. 20091114027_K0903767]